MAREENFLLGSGERLISPVSVPSGGGDKSAPYTFAKARTRAAAKLKVVKAAIERLPESACPRDEAVAILTVHPRYISKSDYPSDLLRSVGLRAIGSRQRRVKPDAWGVKRFPEDGALTEEIFVAGGRRAFARWADTVSSWTIEEVPGAGQLQQIEDIQAFDASSKMRGIPKDSADPMLEIVIHTEQSEAIFRSFLAYAKELGATVLTDRRRDVGGLTFLPVRARREVVPKLAKFSFMRVARGMPALRPFRPALRAAGTGFKVDLPTSPALDHTTRVVIFDGGLPKKGPDLTKWVDLIEPAGIGPEHSELTAHGLAVTGAFLFGPLMKDEPLQTPFCKVDHVRVLDANTGSDTEYVDVLNRITSHLDENPDTYEYVSISLGPDLAVDDDEVTAWTAELDRRFAHDEVLAVVAAGNGGDRDRSARLHRVQPPADGVNVLTVGAANSLGDDWARADYSCMGPGRTPGVVKPDGVAFGGSDDEPFMLLSASNRARPDQGTSFATPLVTRQGVAARVQLGTEPKALTIRALLVHRTERSDQDMHEVGWGRFEHDAQRLITCEDHEVLTIFQGLLPVNEYIRAPIPMPAKLTGRVAIRASLVIAPTVDPGYPGTYTRAGLEVSFRPHSGKYTVNKQTGKRSAHPTTKPFFSAGNMYSKAEYELREDGCKWEPCFHNERSFNADALKSPCFDIEYQHREAGARAVSPAPIPYALVISMRAPEVTDLYNQVVRAYSHVLVPLRPKLRIPLRARR